MSYDISLVSPVDGKTLELPFKHVMTGGTYAASYDETTGTFSALPISETTLNITYNYSKYYYEATDGDPDFAHEEPAEYHSEGEKGTTKKYYGIRGLYGKSGAETIPMLKRMIDRIKQKYPDLESSSDYWDVLPGNAIKPLYQLLAFAELRPDGIWDGD